MGERATGVTLKKKYSPNEKSPNSSGFSSPFSKSNTQSRRYDGELETIEEKKERLFKWNSYQSVKLSQEHVKDTLIENLNILRFINLFESFDQAVLVWGSNEQFQLGLILKKELEKFYNRNISTSEQIKKRQDQILQQIIDIKQSGQQQSNQPSLQESPDQL